MKTTRERVGYGVSRLTGIGLSRTQALGVMGSLMGESGRSLNTGAHNPNDPNGGSSGIAQWHSGRLSGLKSFAKKQGTSWKDYKTQMDYVAHELTTSEKAALEKVRKSTTLEGATRAFTNAYERPNQKYANHAGRAKNAAYASSLIGEENIEPSAYAAESNNSLRSAVDDPIKAIGSLLTGQTGIEDMFGEAGKFGKNAVQLAQGKNPLAAVGGLVDAIDGPNNPMKGITDFLTKPSPTMKLGALAGSILGGPQGALIGGLLGQGLGSMLNSFMNPANQNNDPFAGQPGWGDSNYYPEAPQGGSSSTGNTDRSSWDDRGSKQARDAIDSGSTGLW